MRDIYSKAQIKEMGFPSEKYRFPEKSGTFFCTLKMKQWGKKSLVCYVDADAGSKYRLCLYPAPSGKGSTAYRPRNSNLDVAQIPLGTRLAVTYDVKQNGVVVWINAILTR